MDIHYYMLGYRFEALVASHLEPEAFGRYMAVGTKKLTTGNLLFFAIDPAVATSASAASLRNHFKLADIERRCVPHADGRPKNSKYVSTYRVLEHLDLELIGNLYLVTADGRVLGLEAEPAPPEAPSLAGEAAVHLYQELCPVSPLVASLLPPVAFSNFMTNPLHPVSVPKILFADLLLTRDEFGQLAGDLPYPDPLHIADCLRSLELEALEVPQEALAAPREVASPAAETTAVGATPKKLTKTVARNPALQAFFRTIGSGFYLGAAAGTSGGAAAKVKFYRFPSRPELEVQHVKWWRSAMVS